MKIAVLDADLNARKRHRFPNLVCMKLSGYHKSEGDEVTLKTDYADLDRFDKVYIAKVFTNTKVPSEVLHRKNVLYGGTGFFYDKAVPLPYAIEHHMPDYHLYDAWISTQTSWRKTREFRYYTDYAIGYLTRGCYRGCAFCVNRNAKRSEKHSPIAEFLSPEKKKICLLDDNFFACPHWRQLLSELRQTGRPFQFKQGLDERLLTDEICEMLTTSKYDGEYIFAFDDYREAPIITKKLKLLRKYTDAVCKFYCFTSFDRQGKWDSAFWKRDVLELLYRIEILMRHRCLPYVMRYERYEESPYRGMYITISRWCNQPSFFKKQSLREFVQANGAGSASERYFHDFVKQIPEAIRFSDLKYGAVNFCKRNPPQ